MFNKVITFVNIALALIIIATLTFAFPYFLSTFHVIRGGQELDRALLEQGLGPDAWEAPAAPLPSSWLVTPSPKLIRAVDHLQQAIRWDAKNAQAYGPLGKAFYAQGNYVASAEKLSQYCELQPHDSLVGLRLAEARQRVEKLVIKAEIAVSIGNALGLQAYHNPIPTFSDVPPDQSAYGHIERLAQMEIMRGCTLNPPLFCPEKLVTRAKMAVIIASAKNWGLYDSLGPTFEDVPKTHWAYGYIERLFHEGITGGCGSKPPRYCPDVPITKAEAAVFLEKAFGVLPLEE